MTTQERLRLAARELARQHPKPMTHGQYLHELLYVAADEMDAQNKLLIEVLKSAPPGPIVIFGDSIHPDQTSPMTVGPETFLEEPNET